MQIICSLLLATSWSLTDKDCLNPQSKRFNILCKSLLLIHEALVWFIYSPHEVSAGWLRAAWGHLQGQEVFLEDAEGLSWSAITTLLADFNEAERSFISFSPPVWKLQQNIFALFMLVVVSERASCECKGMSFAELWNRLQGLASREPRGSNELVLKAERFWWWFLSLLREICLGKLHKILYSALNWSVVRNLTVNLLLHGASQYKFCSW